MNKRKKIILPDDFYGKFSFSHHFPHSSEQEIEYIRDILKQLNLPDDDEHTLATLNIIKKIALKIDLNYQDKLKEYKEWRLKQKYIRGGTPFLISLAQQLFIGLILIGIEITALSYLNKQKDPKEAQIINELLKKFQEENEEILVEIKKTYKIRKK